MPDTPPPTQEPIPATDIEGQEATQHSWAGVVAHLHTPDTHGAVLLPRPQQDFAHLEPPLELTTTRLYGPDAQTYIVGTVDRVWRHGNRIYAAGTVIPQPGTHWTEHLLTQGWFPAGPVCGNTTHITSDDNDWWGHDRDPDIDFPPVYAFEEWILLAVSLCDHAPWPGTFIKLTDPEPNTP